MVQWHKLLNRPWVQMCFNILLHILGDYQWQNPRVGPENFTIRGVYFYLYCFLGPINHFKAYLRVQWHKLLNRPWVQMCFNILLHILGDYQWQNPRVGTNNFTIRCDFLLPEQFFLPKISLWSHFAKRPPPIPTLKIFFLVSLGCCLSCVSIFQFPFDIYRFHILI